MKLFASILLVILFCGVADAQSMTSVCANGNCVAVDASNQTGAYEYAVRMNGNRFFRHDPAFRGPEVIFKSSGQATPEEANRWWMNSPPHRRLVTAGLIQDVRRGTGTVSTATIKQTTQPIRNLAPLKNIRVRFKRCR